MVPPMQPRADVLRFFFRSQLPPSSSHWICTAADTPLESCARSSLQLWELSVEGDSVGMIL